MGSVLTFVGTFLRSMLVAGTIAVQIAISTAAREEFIIVFMALELFGLATIIVFALVYGRAITAQATKDATTALSSACSKAVSVKSVTTNSVADCV